MGKEGKKERKRDRTRQGKKCKMKFASHFFYGINFGAFTLA